MPLNLISLLNLWEETCDLLNHQVFSSYRILIIFNKSIRPIDGIITRSTTQCQSGSGSNRNEGVLPTPTVCLSRFNSLNKITYFKCRTLSFATILYIKPNSYFSNPLSLYIYHHHHHHVAPPARISLTVSRHFSLSFIASGRSSGLHPVSSHSCCM